MSCLQFESVEKSVCIRNGYRRVIFGGTVCVCVGGGGQGWVCVCVCVYSILPTWNDNIIFSLGSKKKVCSTLICHHTLMWGGSGFEYKIFQVSPVMASCYEFGVLTYVNELKMLIFESFMKIGHCVFIYFGSKLNMRVLSKIFTSKILFLSFAISKDTDVKINPSLTSRNLSILLSVVCLQCSLPGGYLVERWVRGCAAQIGCFFGLSGFAMAPFFLKVGLDIGCVFAKCIIFDEFFLWFIYRLSKTEMPDFRINSEFRIFSLPISTVLFIFSPFWVNLSKFTHFFRIFEWHSLAPLQKVLMHPNLHCKKHWLVLKRALQEMNGFDIGSKFASSLVLL